ncbi:MAG: phytoene/squalene synthase family protein [Candidatus Bathyarchaeia archaeon]
MINEVIYSIFKRGSRTYFYSSLFFPDEIKKDVFILYSFVRKADNYIDVLPQRKEEFFTFKNRFKQAISGILTGDVVVDSFADLVKRKKIEIEWAEAFFRSMEFDLTKKTYRTIDELKEYLYGSAEVIGLIMAKIMNLPRISYSAARYLGRAMQYANFIRDIPEDLILGRTYFPIEDLERYNLSNLSYAYTKQHPNRFIRFIRHQIERYSCWQEKAEMGFIFLLKKFLVPVKTASDMYKWTMMQINRKPFLVYREKVKPSIPRIICQIAYNTLQ